MLDIRLRKRILQFFNQNLQYIYIQLLCQKKYRVIFLKIGNNYRQLTSTTLSKGTIVVIIL